MKNLLPIRLLDSADPTQAIAVDDIITYDGSVFALLENRDAALDRYLIDISVDGDSGLLFARFSDDSEVVLNGFATIDDVVFTGRGKCGDVGKRGFKGSPALSGRSGRTGQVGCVGVRGDRGLKGLTGDTGIPGLGGDKGLSGLNGELGEKGYKGFKGDMGANGAKGEIGVSGFPGNRGIAGPKGNKGYTGRVGPEGCAGQIGEVGVQGKQGDSGEQGEGGEPGTEIANGAPGPDGIDGEDGAVSTITAGKNMVVSLVRDTEYQISAKCEGCVPITLPPDCPTTTTAPPGGGIDSWHKCMDLIVYNGSSSKTYTLLVGRTDGTAGTTGDLKLDYAISGTGVAKVSLSTGNEEVGMPNYARESGTLTLNKTSSSRTVDVSISLPSFSPAPTLPVQVQFILSCLKVSYGGGYIKCEDAPKYTFGFGSYGVISHGMPESCCYKVDWEGYTGLVELKATDLLNTHEFLYMEDNIRKVESDSTSLTEGITFPVTTNGKVCVGWPGGGKATWTFTKIAGGVTVITTVKPKDPVLVGTIAIRGLVNCAETRDSVPDNSVSFFFAESGRYKIMYQTGAIFVNSTDPSVTWRAGQVIYSDILPNHQFLLPDCEGASLDETVARATSLADSSFTSVDVVFGVHYFWVADINCMDNQDDIISFTIWKL